MPDLLYTCEEKVALLTLNRPTKSNALDNLLLEALYAQLQEAIQNPAIQVILLNAKGPHFCAGADIDWMHRAAQYTESENIQDALLLGRVLHTLHESPKPTIALAQGKTYGGGLGLLCACDIVFACKTAEFCFSEVNLGLIPAIISPFVIKALGARVAKWLFMSAERFNAAQALHFNLIHYVTEPDDLWIEGSNLAQKMSKSAPEAVKDCKKLVKLIETNPHDEVLIQEMAKLIAKKRVSAEGQQGLQAFLNKTKPQWN